MSRRVVVAFLFAAIAAGCTTLSDTYDRWFGSRPAAKPAPLVALQPTAQVRVVWRGEAGPAGKSVFFPAVTGKMLYAASAAGQIAGFETASGKVVTRLNAGQPLTGGVGA